MYFFYLDESGEKNPAVKKDEPFVLLALGLHEYQWRKFEAKINARKLLLIKRIYDTEGVKLELADAEIRSSDVRIPKNRRNHPFLKYLTDNELSELIDLFYSQFEENHITIFSVVVDKGKIQSYLDLEKLFKKVYELLLERVENFLNAEHPKQNSIFVLDNTNKQLNRSIAMKHSFFLRDGTSAKVKIKHVIEIPFFVESYLSNGVQLADLCAYNVYRAFLDQNSSYPFFKKILPYYHKNKNRRADKIEGLKVFLEDNRWAEFIKEVEKERAQILSNRALK
jgi:hypothetical protein